jgi:hypothetical protein
VLPFRKCITPPPTGLKNQNLDVYMHARNGAAVSALSPATISSH